MKNSIMMFIFLCFGPKVYFFWKLVPESKIICWSWNLGPRLISICVMFPFSILGLFRKFCPKINLAISPSILVAETWSQWLPLCMPLNALLRIYIILIATKNYMNFIFCFFFLTIFANSHIFLKIIPLSGVCFTYVVFVTKHIDKFWTGGKKDFCIHKAYLAYLLDLLSHDLDVNCHTIFFL